MFLLITLRLHIVKLLLNIFKCEAHFIRIIMLIMIFLSLDRDTCSSVPLDDRCYLEIKSLYTQNYENGR